MMVKRIWVSGAIPDMAVNRICVSRAIPDMAVKRIITSFQNTKKFFSPKLTSPMTDLNIWYISKSVSYKTTKINTRILITHHDDLCNNTSTPFKGKRKPTKIIPSLFNPFKETVKISTHSKET
jgi:hypothetical protein